MIFPTTIEDDYIDHVNQRHDECGCEGVEEPCECVPDCSVCWDIEDGRRWNLKASF
jgi:hypothetical protein